jgi:hypothetical protein
LSLVNARRLNCTADTSMSVVNPHFLGNIDENIFGDDGPAKGGQLLIVLN